MDNNKVKEMSNMEQKIRIPMIAVMMSPVLQLVANGDGINSYPNLIRDIKLHIFSAINTNNMMTITPNKNAVVRLSFFVSIMIKFLSLMSWVLTSS